MYIYTYKTNIYIDINSDIHVCTHIYSFLTCEWRVGTSMAFVQRERPVQSPGRLSTIRDCTHRIRTALPSFTRTSLTKKSFACLNFTTAEDALVPGRTCVSHTTEACTDGSWPKHPLNNAPTSCTETCLSSVFRWVRSIVFGRKKTCLAMSIL